MIVIKADEQSQRSMEERKALAKEALFIMNIKKRYKRRGFYLYYLVAALATCFLLVDAWMSSDSTSVGFSFLAGSLFMICIFGFMNVKWMNRLAEKLKLYEPSTLTIDENFIRMEQSKKNTIIQFGWSEITDIFITDNLYIFTSVSNFSIVYHRSVTYDEELNELLKTIQQDQKICYRKY